MRLARRPAAAVLAFTALAGGLAACSSSGGGSGGSDGKAGTTAPNPDAAGGRHSVNVTLTAAKGCVPDTTHLAAGGITFTVTNQDATGVSEIEVLDGQRIVGEKENVAPGLSGQFAIQVAAGTYELYCPGAATERTTLTVSGAGSATGDQDVAALLKTATVNYAAYVKTQVGYLLDSATKLDAAVKSGDIAKAKAAYIAARPFYEKIEPVAESFTVGSDSVDADIDARENDVPASQWKGMHVIEKALWQTKSLKGMDAVAAELVTNVKKLQELTGKLTYQPTELANGAEGLLDEVAASKVTGEEERYSHVDVLDIAYNVEGSEQAYAQLQPALQKIDPALAKQIEDAFAALDAQVDKYRSKSDPSGFDLYSQLSAADLKQLASAVKVVQEPLSKVSSKVANA